MGRAILERERELAELDAAVATACSGDGSVVLIMGEPGIGKSSLVNAIYALQASGNWRAAVTLWQEAGCEYEYASALAESPDPADVLEALTMLDAIRADPLARRIRQKPQQLGVTRIPRGPAQSTRDNPAGLTQRQAGVVALLASGLSNAEIAAQLVLSVRTVDAHVAAILAKLDVQTRHETAAMANALGITVG